MLPLPICPRTVAEVGSLAALDVDAPHGGGRLHHLAVGQLEHVRLLGDQTCGAEGIIIELDMYLL